MFEHYTVMENEAIEALNVQKDGIYIDCTFGGGGHTALLLSKLSSKGRILCFDQDEVAIKHGKERFRNEARIEFIHSNFESLHEVLKQKGIEEVSGILFDLGVSSPQLDVAERGFSYMQDSRLDMRMDQRNTRTAEEIVKTYSEQELIQIFQKYGDEKFSKNIARRIVQEREEHPITTTYELVDIIERSIPKKAHSKIKGHKAKKVFQALRIEVNKELDVFEKALQDALCHIAVNGRVVVITFQSLEDKVCKYIFKENSELKKEFEKLPIVPEEYLPKFKRIERKVILPSDVELAENSRSKSAKMRVLERIRN